MLEEMKEKTAEEKEKLKQLSGKEKLQYFRDYYLLYVVIIVVALSIIIFLTVHFLNPPKQPDCYIALLDCEASDDDKEKSEEQIETYSNGQITYAMVDSTFDMSEDGLNKLQVYVSNNRIDVLVMDRELFEVLSGYGYFADLQDILTDDLYYQYKDKMISVSGYKETDNISFEDKETGQGAVRPYGIAMSEYELLPDTNLKEPVFAVAANTRHLENAILILQNTIK